MSVACVYPICVNPFSFSSMLTRCVVVVVVVLSFGPANYPQLSFFLFSTKEKKKWEKKTKVYLKRGRIGSSIHLRSSIYTYSTCLKHCYLFCLFSFFDARKMMHHVPSFLILSLTIRSNESDFYLLTSFLFSWWWWRRHRLYQWRLRRDAKSLYSQNLRWREEKKKETKSRKNRLKIKAFTSDCQRLYYAVSFYIYICVYTIQSILSANPDRFFIVVDVVSSSIPLQDLLFGIFYLTSLNTVSPSQMVSLRAWITNDVWCWTESFPLSSFLFSSSKKNKIKKKFKERRKKGACEKESDINSKLMVYFSSQFLQFS